MMAFPQDSSISKVPGFFSTHSALLAKKNFRKSQLLQQMSNGYEKTSTIRDLPLAEQVQHDNQPKVPEHQLGVQKTEKQTSFRPPVWVTHANDVLRFFGYFETKNDYNSIHADNVVRRVVVYFYLVDNTISVTEPRVRNSGMMQGAFLRRGVVYRPEDNQPYSPEHLQVGGCVQLNGRTIHLVDCDHATRAYYQQKKGIKMPSPLAYPDESQHEVGKLKPSQAKITRRREAIRRADRARKFHENKGKVLRFYASWHDRHPWYPETKNYVLHYYLEDDTLDIVEAKTNKRMESGRGHFSLLSQRRRIQRDKDTTKETVSNVKSDANVQDDGYLNELDLVCGNYVTICSRRFLLNDCDKFTRSYYLETHGIDQSRPETQTDTSSAHPLAWKIFKKEDENQDDDRANAVKGLRGDIGLDRLKAHLEDYPFYKRDALDHKELRFRAKFAGSSLSEVDRERRFLVSYYLGDDTMSIYEPALANSGVVGGQFLGRGRYRKSRPNDHCRDKQSSRSYIAEDMYVGAVICFDFLPSQKLQIVEADLQTLDYCEMHPKQFPYSNIAKVMYIIVQYILMHKVQNIRRRCRKLDYDGKKSFTSAQLQLLLLDIGILETLNDHQCLTLLRAFPTHPHDRQCQDPLFDYEQFCDAIAMDYACEHDTCPQHTHLRHELATVRGLRWLLASSCNDANQSLRGNDIEHIFDMNGIAVDDEAKRELQDLVNSSGGKVSSQLLCDYVLLLPFDDLTSDFEELAYQSTENFSSTPETLKASKETEAQVKIQEQAKLERVRKVLQEYFFNRKYELRRALRRQDNGGSGQVFEDDFMAALSSVEPNLRDEDMFIIAQTYFPTNNSVLNYTDFLQHAF